MRDFGYASRVGMEPTTDASRASECVGCEAPTGPVKRLAPLPGRSFPMRSAEERFWSKVDKREDGCWWWLGSQTPGKNKQYGNFWLSPGASPVRAHRFAYEMCVGPIPPGLQIDHLCMNTLCVRPDHLEPVTNRENSRRYRASKITTP